MKKHDPQNERLKLAYQNYLRHHQGLDHKSIDKAMLAIRQFEESTNCKSFKQFRKEQAMEFKDWLETAKNSRTGKPLSLARPSIRRRTYVERPAWQELFQLICSWDWCGHMHGLSIRHIAAGLDEVRDTRG